MATNDQKTFGEAIQQLRAEKTSIFIGDRASDSPVVALIAKNGHGLDVDADSYEGDSEALVSDAVTLFEFLRS